MKKTFRTFMFAAFIVLTGFYSCGCGGSKEVAVKKTAEPEKVAQENAQGLKEENAQQTQTEIEKPLQEILKIDIGEGIMLELVKIKSGKFTMGQMGDKEDEQPLREVTLTKDFFIGKYEVTQEQYKKIMNHNPSRHSPANSYPDNSKQPVENVTRAEAAMFCNELSKKLGLKPCYRILPGETLTETLVFWEEDGDGFRLPTEAEWEYCCRAGTQTRFFWGDEVNDQIANQYMWCNENACDSGWKEPHALISGTQPVGTKSANPWGLHDMYGNVAEWCWYWYSENYLDLDGNPLVDPRGGGSTGYGVLRGGAYFFDAQGCYSARRIPLAPGEKDNDHNGFRLVKGI